MVLAPCFGLPAKTMDRRTMAAKIPPSLCPRPVATKPGCRQFAVTPVPATREFAREQDVGELGAPICCHWAIILFHLQVIEIEEIALMGARHGIHDARRR